MTSSADILTKRCSRCGESKPLGAFPPNRYVKSGRQSYCRDCSREITAERRASNPDYRLRGYNQSKAYNRAMARLRDLHPEDFARLHAEELGRLGPGE